MNCSCGTEIKIWREDGLCNRCRKRVENKSSRVDLLTVRRRVRPDTPAEVASQLLVCMRNIGAFDNMGGPVRQLRPGDAGFDEIARLYL